MLALHQDELTVIVSFLHVRDVLSLCQVCTHTTRAVDSMWEALLKTRYGLNGDKAMCIDCAANTGVVMAYDEKILPTGIVNARKVVHVDDGCLVHIAADDGVYCGEQLIVQRGVDIAAIGGIVRSLLVLTRRKFYVYEYRHDALVMECAIHLLHGKRILKAQAIHEIARCELTDGTVIGIDHNRKVREYMLHIEKIYLTDKVTAILEGGRLWVTYKNTIPDMVVLSMVRYDEDRLVLVTGDRRLVLYNWKTEAVTVIDYDLACTQISRYDDGPIYYVRQM
jgi:hypothetical protein